MNLLSSFNSSETWIAIGLLTLQVSFALGRWVPPSNVNDFVQGVFMGISIATNLVGIAMLPGQLKRRNR
jgi:hypothetical protein